VNFINRVSVIIAKGRRYITSIWNFELGGVGGVRSRVQYSIINRWVGTDTRLVKKQTLFNSNMFICLSVA
jgi:hypothetical protein